MGKTEKTETKTAETEAAAGEKKENKMGVMPMNRLLVSMSLPMMISMLVQAFYNIVDSIFVARIKDGAGEAGTSALSALGMAFPFQMLMIAFASGLCVGVNAMLSKALGEKDHETVQKAANHGVFLTICNYLIFLLVGIFLSGALIASQKGEGLTLEYGTQYLTIVCCGSLGIYSQFIFERLLQSTGRTIYTMFTQITGAVINIILDPILIFGLFGFPELKVTGAAIATIAGQFCAGALAIFFNLKRNEDVQINMKGFRPELHVIKRIYAVGFPSVIMQAIGSVMTFSMNRILTGLNEASVAVFTVYFKLQSLFFMPVFGLNNGMIPILAFNFGARKRKRMMKVIRLSMVYAFFLLLVGFILFETIPELLLRIFDTGDASLITLGVPALRIIAFHYLLAWFCIIGGTVFQALGNGLYSLIVSVARQLVVLIPVAYILSVIGGLDLIWWCFPIAELMSLAVTSFFLIRIYRKVIAPIPE
ncbi:MAG: MATE family efflux transporter [Lachnospiraceae bacterium]|nr:MATE family efflux transporter [Lachnospiraceae bacterium]